MSGVAESLLALSFGDVEALGASGILCDGCEQQFDQFSNWALLDLLVERFPDVARPTLRFEVHKQIDRCKGDPLMLLHRTSRGLNAAPASRWNQRFPLSIFASVAPDGRQIGFDIADAHLHSGASVPLPLFFGALASTKAPIDRSALAYKKIRSGGGGEWDLHALLTATRWALRLLRYLRDGESLFNLTALSERKFDHGLVEKVENEEFWPIVKQEAKANASPGRSIAQMSCSFEFDGLCSVEEVFWTVAENSDYDVPGKRAFLIGLVRACASVSSVVTARPGDGLTRFVDRFREMGMTRDAALGEMRATLTRSTLDHIAASKHVVGAEFRKTIVEPSPKEFKREVLAGLESHHSGFSSFVKEEGRAMALSMPVGFLRRPCTGLGGDWTDLRQLREAMIGYAGLRRVLAGDDGTLLAAISTIDVAGDEYGSASWPFAAVAELLRRDGFELGYAIHAGEAFYSQLNGVRRVGELFLADRKPERIGHALALDEDAAKAVCAGGTPPPIRIGDAICDLAWSVISGCCDESTARDLLYELVRGSGGRAFDPTVWIDAYRSLFCVEALLQHGILVDSGGRLDVHDDEVLELTARTGGSSTRALAALAWGAGPEIAHADVRDLVPENLSGPLSEFDAATATAARGHVREQVRSEGVVIEACPTSNIRLANLGSVRDHPIWEWKESGVRVVVGSDDPLIFGATIADEFHEMLPIGGSELVRDIARETLACCSGGRRRRLAELETIVTRAAASGESFPPGPTSV